VPDGGDAPGGAGAQVGTSAPAGESSHAVFISYASEDTAAAERIATALRAGGIEVWFDKSELRGGDAWDQMIRRQIRDCALFVPIISGNSEARPEGYFRLEWDLADQRSHMIVRHRPFMRRLLFLGMQQWPQLATTAEYPPKPVVAATARRMMTTGAKVYAVIRRVVGAPSAHQAAAPRHARCNSRLHGAHSGLRCRRKVPEVRRERGRTRLPGVAVRCIGWRANWVEGWPW